MERYLFKIQKTLCMCKLWPENQIKTTTQFTLWFRVWIACQVSKLLEAADINCLTLNLTWGPNTSSVPHLLWARDDISVPLGISSFLFSNFLDWILRKIQVYIIYFGIKPQGVWCMILIAFSHLSVLMLIPLTIFCVLKTGYKHAKESKSISGLKKKYEVFLTNIFSVKLENKNWSYQLESYCQRTKKRSVW